MVNHAENYEVNGLRLNNGRVLVIPIFSTNSLLCYAHSNLPVKRLVTWTDTVWSYSQCQDLRILCTPLFMLPTCCYIISALTLPCVREVHKFHIQLLS